LLPFQYGEDSIMSRTKRTSTDDIADIEREISGLLRDIEHRVSRLNSLSRNGAAHAFDEAGGYVSDAISKSGERLRDGAQMVGDGAARLGNDALRRIETEIEQRPLLTLAIAAGIGFIAGMSGRRG
jgi:ElaB/YqjD/DUF883 family membrane-anchored ribosome-binding protein